MAEAKDETNSQNDDLICPITLQLFRDPVISKDGHVYEREAITKWILEHGTSPLTRESLRIDDLQPDDYLKQLAAQRKNSTISHSTVVLSHIEPVKNDRIRQALCDPNIRLHLEEANPRSVLGHGTSLSTRFPLPRSQLRPDDSLRSFSDRQINSTVLYNAQNNTVNVLPLPGVPRFAPPVVPTRPRHRCRINYPLRLICYECCYAIIILVLVLMTKRLGIISNSNAYTNSTVHNSTTSKLKIISSYSSSLTINSSIYISPRQQLVTAPYYYQSIQVIVSVSGNYTFKSNSSIDIYGCLYRPYFNLTYPIKNLLVCDDDSGGSLQFYFSIFLSSDNYTLVATTYRKNTIGSFSIIVTGPAIVTFR